MQWTDPYTREWNPSLQPPADELVGGIPEIYAQTSDLVSRATLLRQIEYSNITGPSGARYKELLKELVELGFARAAAWGRWRQAYFQRTAGDLALAQAEADITRLQQRAANYRADVGATAEVVRSIVARAQDYCDLLQKYVFFSARALDLYTGSATAQALSLDLGRLPVDEEDEAYRRLARGEAGPALSLVQRYADTMARLPSVIFYRDQYLEYEATLVSGLLFVHLTDAGALAGFAATGLLEFDVTADRLPQVTEAKVATVYVSLLGATARDPRVTCRLEHSGRNETWRGNGSLARTLLPPRATTVAANFDADTFGGLDSPRPPFWGRSPITRWRLSVDEAARQQAALNLTGLTEVQVLIAYLYRP
ncbi:hypothetical protein [Phytohabitans rumicis]|uniref:Tc toxin complex TcA C-terminal TcB-binding domain-containing protein n=1 Tax=Phytohabitans rumicis TaxID=1076125 RepID=A0A6V8KZ27_9ACTN|nr:hypothetical protein [Phytohabitans rumicis]GFJ87701.1 hypothetical protein Prum_013430 [Phytohabitans rumicis]